MPEEVRPRRRLRVVCWGLADLAERLTIGAPATFEVERVPVEDEQEPEEAEKHYLIAAQYHAKILDVLGQAASIKELADLHTKLENFQEAEKWYSQSLDLLKHGEANRVLGSIHEGMGHMHWKANHIPKAIDSFTHARDTFATLHYNMGVEHMTHVLKRLNRLPNSRSNPQDSSAPEGYAIH